MLEPQVHEAFVDCTIDYHCYFLLTIFIYYCSTLNGQNLCSPDPPTHDMNWRDSHSWNLACHKCFCGSKTSEHVRMHVSLTTLKLLKERAKKSPLQCFRAWITRCWWHTTNDSTSSSCWWNPQASSQPLLEGKCWTRPAGSDPANQS